MKRVQCPICQELFVDFNCISALSCGHCFHPHCIQHWLVQQPSKRSCPSCRREKVTCIDQLYFSEALEDEVDGMDVDAVRQKLRDVRSEFESTVSRVSTLELQLEKSTKDKEDALKQAAHQKDRLLTTKHKLDCFILVKEQNEELEKRCDDQRLELEKARKHLKDCGLLRDLLNAKESVENVVETLEKSESADLRSFIAVMKKEYDRLSLRNKKQRDDIASLETSVRSLKLENKTLKEEKSILREELKIREITTPCNPRVKKLLNSSCLMPKPKLTDPKFGSSAWDFLPESEPEDSSFGEFPYFRLTERKHPANFGRDESVSPTPVGASPKKKSCLDSVVDDLLSKPIGPSPLSANLPGRNQQSAVALRFGGVGQKMSRKPLANTRRPLQISKPANSGADVYMVQKPRCRENVVASPTGNNLKPVGLSQMTCSGTFPDGLGGLSTSSNRSSMVGATLSTAMSSQKSAFSQRAASRSTIRPASPAASRSRSPMDRQREISPEIHNLTTARHSKPPHTIRISGRKGLKSMNSAGNGTLKSKKLGCTSQLSATSESSNHSLLNRGFVLGVNDDISTIFLD